MKTKKNFIFIKNKKGTKNTKKNKLNKIFNKIYNKILELLNDFINFLKVDSNNSNIKKKNKKSRR